SAADALGKIKSDKAVEPLIKALAEGDNEVRRSAADALGEIKSDKAVEPLIKALAKGDNEVRRSAADALGKIKSDKAVEPLIKALTEEDYFVRRSAARALGEIKYDKAVESLIKAVTEGDYFVRRSAADELGEIITTENKYLLKPLLESQNEYVVNTSYDILKKIDQNDRSEKKITLKKISISEKDDSNNSDNQELPCGRPAEEGLKDPYIGSFVDRLKSIKEPTSIVDYGCGQGKLLCRLTTLPDVAIKNISFYGVDENTRCRYTSRLTAEKYGFFNSFKTEPEFLKPKDFYAKDIRLDYALLMHALHEIKLLDLIEIIYSISAKLKIGGQMFILDQREL
ncbi:MAG: HEAT repeat domain-containing protein, partial [ANME-2 cluster archaeon]|nr:HEAT repeat domain-containing protein [ANME-2 cluster archaeon]